MFLGATVEEAKQRVSYGEALQWFEYRKRYGGIGIAATNRLLSTMATQINRFGGGEADIADFLYVTKPESTDEASIGEVMNLLSGVV